MKLFSSILWGYENIKSNFNEVRNYLALDEVIDQKIERKINNHLE